MRPAPRILLIEDDALDAQLTTLLLREGIPDCSVTRADSLAAAIARLDAEPFAVVLLDLGLPDARGMEGLRRLRDAGMTTPIVVLTGLDDTDLAAEMISAGAQDYLVKGRLKPATLARVLRFAVRRHAHPRSGDLDARTADSPLIALVGRHRLLLDGVAAALRASADYGVLEPAGSTTQLDLPPGRDLAAVIVHLGEDLDARDAPTAALRTRFGSARIVLLAGDTDRWLPAILDRDEADALLPDTSSARQIVAALDRVLGDEVVLPPGWRAQRLRRTASDPLEVLSARQREVLVQAAGGASNEQISAELFISVNTVKFHLRSAYGALGIHSRLQAAQLVAGRHS